MICRLDQSARAENSMAGVLSGHLISDLTTRPMSSHGEVRGIHSGVGKRGTCGRARSDRPDDAVLSATGIGLPGLRRAMTSVGGAGFAQRAPANHAAAAKGVEDLIVVVTEINTDEDRAAYAHALKEVLA